MNVLQKFRIIGIAIKHDSLSDVKDCILWSLGRVK